MPFKFMLVNIIWTCTTGCNLKNFSGVFVGNRAHCYWKRSNWAHSKGKRKAPCYRKASHWTFWDNSPWFTRTADNYYWCITYLRLFSLWFLYYKLIQQLLIVIIGAYYQTISQIILTSIYLNWKSSSSGWSVVTLKPSCQMYLVSKLVPIWV